MDNTEYKQEQIKVEKLEDIIDELNPSLSTNDKDVYVTSEKIASDLAEMYENEGINNISDFKNKNLVIANKLDKLLEKGNKSKINKIDTLGVSKELKNDEVKLYDKLKNVVKGAIIGSLPIVGYFLKAFSYVLSKAHILIKNIISVFQRTSSPKFLLKYVGIAVIAWFLFKLMKKPILYIFQTIKTEQQLTDSQINEAFSIDNLKMIICEEENRFISEKITKKIKELKENVKILNDMLDHALVLKAAAAFTIFAFLFGLYKMMYFLLIGCGLFICIDIINKYYTQMLHNKKDRKVEPNTDMVT